MRVSETGRAGHFWFGAFLVLLGLAGVLFFWDAFGQVARGFVPAILLGGGLVMFGTGLRLRHPDRGTTSAIESWISILVVVACVVLAVAAAGGWSVDLGDRWTLPQVAGYLALGFGSGVVGGMLGLGGGVVHLSGMTLLFGFPFAFARGATLINNVFINASAATHYGRRGFLSWEIIAILLPTSLVGVTVGSFLQSGFDETLMRQIFAVFVLLITFSFVIDTLVSRQKAPEATEDPVSPSRHGFTGGLAGLLSGILGISGGIVAVPGQTLLGGVPLRGAIANSTLTTSISSALGVLLLFIPGSRPSPSVGEMITIAVLFIPGNLLGGHLGARWMGHLPVLAVRFFFLAGLLAIAYRSWIFLR